ncbi:hypothetical protein EKO04_007285 [Ascochyta lentis]|uniref:Uncharacterized protein n=1 Tax=Ascochyta lentis TaxID=205686 RepID=A0A8H7IZK4_9PLEO|nr:hypothetical protein EKO04_007285 [Ascochyta lentis]
MSKPTTAPTSAPLTIPMGFSAQIKALQENQRTQAARISALEHENALLKATHRTPTNLPTRLQTLEHQTAHLTARRKETVAQLLNLRTLHQEASNAFLVRASDIEEDDLEGMLAVYATSITTVLTHHQRALGQLRALGHRHGYVAGGCCPVAYAYPALYSQTGYCLAHQVPYPCCVCGR